MIIMMMMRRRREIMVIKCRAVVAEWILINLRTIEPVLIICWERYIAQAAPGTKVAESENEWKRDYDRDNATMLTCRLHTWSKQRGKHCRLFEPLRFQCPFHICHTYPCASENISWRWDYYWEWKWFWRWPCCCHHVILFAEDLVPQGVVSAGYHFLAHRTVLLGLLV